MKANTASGANGTAVGILLLVLLAGACDSSNPSDAGPSDAAAADAGEVGPPQAVTLAGAVVGVTRGGAHVFYGIPYAAPPVGDLRFRAPSAPAPWSEPRDATSPGAFCPQREPTAPLDPRGGESEGCLELNVFTPDLDPAEPLPVMVFFHGGSFTIGAANSELYDASALAARGVVVVTVNYRLGLAGFLAHPALDAEADGSSGMYGILDQQASLRWVRDNAASFGGDPSRVTIFGESAGATAVCLHYFAPASRGLFHAAISQSGGCIGEGDLLIGAASHDAARVRGVEVATELGCAGTDAAAAACLRALSADALVDAIRVGSLPEANLTYGVLAVGPNVDGTVLTDSPVASLASGEHAAVPFLVGTNRDEGTFFSDDALITTELELATALAQLVPGHGDDLTALYVPADHGSPLAAYDAAVRDLGFACPTRALARGLAEDGVDVYLYELNQTNAGAVALDLGVMHGIDLLYVFGNTPLPFTRPSAAERNVTESMQSYWTRFGATGDPGGEGAGAWPVFDASERYLELAEPPVPRTEPHRAACDALWAALAP